MTQCLYFINDDCQNEFSTTAVAPQSGCEGEFTRCYLRASDQQLSGYINGKLLDGEADLTFNRGDIRGVLRVEKDTWLALELARRYGRSQTRNSKMKLSLRGYGFQFSTTAKPLIWEEWALFSLDLLFE